MQAMQNYQTQRKTAEDKNQENHNKLGQRK
jgi:hypothetical protein